MGTVYLHDLICPAPDFEKEQSDSFQWLKSAYSHYQKSHTSTPEDYEKLLKRVGVNPAQIQSRGYFLADFHLPASEARIFTPEKILGMSARQKFFQSATSRIFENLYETRNLPEQLIHVTCTGYVSPSAAQLLASEKSPGTQVTHSYHMGCYGAFPALRMARGFVSASPEEQVDIVHTELCTLHLNPEDPSLEQMLVQTLFADGVAAYRVSGRKPREGFECFHLTEFLVPGTAEAMSWTLAESGFQMTLSKDVPQLIARNLREALVQWEGQMKIKLSALLKEAIIAVHPGGPKIIDFVAQLLELREDQVRYSRKVLKEHGNMSSATVPHIWREILSDPQVAGGTPVISMAFGPGLTVALSLMRVVR